VRPTERDALPDEHLPGLLASYSRRLDALAEALASASQVVVEASWPCLIGEPGGSDPREIFIHPPDNLFVGRGLSVGLAGRHERRTSSLCYWRTHREWTKGSVLVSGSTIWVPAECWTPRILAEAARRLVVALCERAAIAPALPEVVIANRWHLTARAQQASRRSVGLAAAIAEIRAEAEDEALDAWKLNRRGQQRFLHLGRDPAQPLGTVSGAKSHD
jgi:hypothetical protein